MQWPVLITVNYRGTIEANSEDEAREKVESAFAAVAPNVPGFTLEGTGPEEVDAQNLFKDDSE